MVGCLSTNRINIRQIVREDAEFIIELVNDPDWLAHIGDRNVHSIKEAIQFIENGPIASYSKYDFGLYVYQRVDSSIACGLCGLIQREYLDAPDIGYATLPHARGQGLTFEAARHVLDYETQRLQLNKVYAMVSLQNHASIKLIERLGFVFHTEFEPENTPTKLFVKTFKSNVDQLIR